MKMYNGKHFRVKPIIRLDLSKESGFHKLPISEGLAIELKCGDYAIVVGFVEWDDDEQECFYRDVSFRTAENLNAKNIAEYKNAIRQARKLVSRANDNHY